MGSPDMAIDRISKNVKNGYGFSGIEMLGLTNGIPGIPEISRSPCPPEITVRPSSFEILDLLCFQCQKF